MQHIELIAGPLPAIVYALAAITLVGLIIWRPRVARSTSSTRSPSARTSSTRSSSAPSVFSASSAPSSPAGNGGPAERPDRTVGTLVVGVLGFGVGWLVAFLLSDVWVVAGVQFSVPTRFWIAALTAGVAVGIANLVRTTWRRKAVALLATVLSVAAAAIGINADVGQFPTLGTALGADPYATLSDAVAAASGRDVGVVGRVDIPATTSGFPHRQALVYLPPAALVTPKTRLPVIEMLSGQPGRPDDVFTSGRLAGILDAFARNHHGEAPIVVVPDQLGRASDNPMCVDSALGRSASYLTVDVPAWIRSHFDVSTVPTGWTIAGFSQGGTCSVQLGSAHPEIYGTIVDISGEIAPKNGDRQQSIDRGFGGDAAAYDAAAPSAILRAKAPYQDLAAVFGAGSADTLFLPWAKTLEADAAAAGATTSLFVSPGTAHDWYTVRYVFSHALPTVWERRDSR